MKKEAISLAVCVAIAAMLSAGKRERPDNPVKGKELFTQCTGCHNADTDEKKVGPSLKGLFKRAKLHNGKELTEARVRAQVSKGSDSMPGFADELSDREIDDLIAYLKTL